MRSDDLTPRQVTALLIRVRRISTFLFKLESRILQQQFPADDRLRIATSEARAKVQTLTNLVHMLACGDWGGGCVARLNAEVQQLDDELPPADG